LFIKTEERILKISDAYPMAIAFLLFYAVGKPPKLVIEKQKKE